MTTKHSPIKRLKRQAREVAAALKGMERREIAVKDGARERDRIKFAVAMDDKILSIEMTWEVIRTTPEAGIAEFILNHMRETRAPTH